MTGVELNAFPPTLGGRAILLSAGVPRRGARPPPASKRRKGTPAGGGTDIRSAPPTEPWSDIDEAVICLTRAAIARGGRIVCAGDGTVSLLVAQVAAEYWRPPPVEGQDERPRSGPPGEPGSGPRADVVLYDLPSVTLQPELQLLSRYGMVELRARSPLPKGSDRATASNSVRERIIEIEDPVALVCIAGGRAVLDDAAAFGRLRPRNPIFSIATTGGAAAQLAGRGRSIRPAALPLPVQAIDLEVERELASRRAQHRPPERDGRGGDELERLSQRDREDDERSRQTPYTPYALVMQLLVERLGGADAQPR